MRRRARIRRWFHRQRGHKVVMSVDRDYREIGRGRFDFFFRKGFLCVACNKVWH